MKKPIILRAEESGVLGEIMIWVEDKEVDTSIYDMIDEQLEKAGLIEGKQPLGTKSLGMQIEYKAYVMLKEKIKDFLDALSPAVSKDDAIESLINKLEEWQVEINEIVSDDVEELFKRGFKAGIIQTEITPAIGRAGKLVLAWLKENPDGILPALKTFGEDSRKKFEKIIAKYYEPDVEFSLDNIVKDMNQAVAGERWKMERIVRTSTTSTANAGRLFAWSEDSDKYFWNYFWQASPDSRAKEVSIWRMRQNPISYDEAMFLWQRQRQDMGGKTGIQDDTFNNRCSLSRSPRNDEYKGNRWEGDGRFFQTMSLGI